VGGGGCDGLPAAWLAALYDLRCSFIHLALGGMESLPVGPAHIAQANGVLAVTNQLALIECEWVGRVGLEAVGWFGLGGNLYLPRTRAHSGEKHKHVHY